MAGKGAPTNGSVYVCNLPPGTDETMLADYFGTIGVVKVELYLGILSAFFSSGFTDITFDYILLLFVP